MKYQKTVHISHTNKNSFCSTLKKENEIKQEKIKAPTPFYQIEDSPHVIVSNKEKTPSH